MSVHSHTTSSALARLPRVTPRAALVVVLALYVSLGMLLVALKPPWEAPDEVDHVKNVEALVSGRLYRIRPADGVESYQPPLYYALLAGWQRAWGLEAKQPAPATSSDCARAAYFGETARCSLYDHDTPADGDDQRRLALLRSPGVLFGTLVIVLAAAVARRLTSDPWTPVVAAAIVASVPSFVVASASVNNDSLASLLGAVATLLAVVALARRENGNGPRWPLAIALGLVVGAFVLTKLTALLLVPALVTAVWLSARGPRQRSLLILALCAVALAVGGWWLIRNVSLYGDPLAATATDDHLRRVIPWAFSGEPPLERMLVRPPRTLWEEFWYRSQQFRWGWWAYLPFWLLSVGGVVALVRDRRGWAPRPLFGRAVIVLALLALGAFATVWAVGAAAATAGGGQTRYAFIGLPAFACLIALGFERLRAPVLARFVLPAIGFAGTLVVVRNDVLGVYL
jgi:hypothetical protein